MNKDLLEQIRKLVADFSAQNGWQNSEEHIQTTFTIKLLELLGWSGSNWMINQGQDVNTGKKPDILLMDDSKNTLLVVESKDAKKSDKLDGKYANKTFEEQLYKYCEAEGVQWGILTNFVEWRIYSIYQKRIYKEKHYAFHDLLWANVDKSRYIDLLSAEGLAFLAKLQKNELTRTHGRWDDDTVYYPKQEEIKAEFFAKLKNWRAKLRTHFQKQHGKEYTLYQIDLMTQRIIDRLIFVDYCADNHVIPQDKLHAILHSKSEIYEEVKKIFRQMDEKFNSELFMLAKSDKLCVPDEVIRPIIEELAAIDFTRLSVHVIGEVYENYLGELLRQSKGGIVVEDEKASKKKKSQGIYYTPDYIVDYIVSRTVGERLAKCKTEAEVAAVKVLDPACGSGSFLIRVFDEFLKHYRRVTKDGGMFEFELRKKILTQNLYGVDLDEKAVEITKLNLMIKALEGIGYQDLSGRKLIPNLKLNIRCGNSLIGGEQIKRQKGDNLFDNYKFDLARLTELRTKYHTNLTDETKQKVYAEIEMLEEKVNMELNKELETEELNPKSVHAFNYSVAFPDVLSRGGFDVVVGNPPYIKEYENKQIFDEVRKAGLDDYCMGKMDIWYVFASKALDLLRDGGYHSFIAQNNWVTSHGAKKLRAKIRADARLLSFFDFNDFKVFPTAGIQTMIYVMQKEKAQRSYGTEYARVDDKSISEEDLIAVLHGAKSEKVSRVHGKLSPKDGDAPITFASGELDDVLEKIKRKGNFWLEEKEVGQGIIGGPDQAFLYSRNDGFTKTEQKYLHRHYSSAGKYHAGDSPNCVSYLTKKNCESLEERQSPNFFINLQKFKKKLDGRRETKSGQMQYFHLHWPRDEKFFKVGKKIICPTRVYEPAFFYTEDEYYASRALNLLVTDRIDLKYLTAILNSKLAYFWLKHRGKRLGEMLQIDKGFLLEIPIYVPDLANSVEKSKHDGIVKLVDQLLELNKTATSRTENAVRIRALESKVDDLVFELYGLSEEERKVVLDS